VDSCGRLWTAVDTAWRSTDQKVGDSSSPGRADESPAFAGVLSSGWSLGQVAGWLWEPFFLCPAFAAIGDSETIDMGGHRRTRSPLGSAGYGCRVLRCPIVAMLSGVRIAPCCGVFVGVLSGIRDGRGYCSLMPLPRTTTDPLVSISTDESLLAHRSVSLTLR
jgi:hypothetical protein